MQATILVYIGQTTPLTGTWLNSDHPNGLATLIQPVQGAIASLSHNHIYIPQCSVHTFREQKIKEGVT